MSDRLTIRSRFDGFEVPAYRFAPGNARRGGLIVIQEIFGANEHIRSVAAAYAEDGYEVLVPAMFERAAPGFETGYDPKAFVRGRMPLKMSTRDGPSTSGWVGSISAVLIRPPPPGVRVRRRFGRRCAWRPVVRPPRSR